MEEITFNCEVCEKPYKNFKSLKSHRRQIHELANLQLKCTKCEKSFTSKTGLKNHYNSVHEKITFECQLCQKTFRTITSLKDIIKLESTIKPKILPPFLVINVTKVIL